MAQKKENQRYELEIPLDASQIEGFEPEQGVKVAVRDRDGALYVDTVRFDKKGHGTAAFKFEKHPGPVQIIVGPESAEDRELPRLQTMTFGISSARWKDELRLIHDPVLIPPYYWYMWLEWCRRYVIRGRVVCPDGHPVPGAKVCAYDVDGFFALLSEEEVGCTYTDINGAFELRFRFCCGWHPWWWLRDRVWLVDPVLRKLIEDLLARHPELRLSPRTSDLPNLSMFRHLLAGENIDFEAPLAEIDPGHLESLRKRLVEKLPPAPDLVRLHVWPYVPYRPWWRCAPDIIFRVTQECVDPDTVIVDEDFSDTRWDIPRELTVTLVANEEACCFVDEPGDAGECLVMTSVCGRSIDEIGGNLGALASPAGYVMPDAVSPGADSWEGDRPFAGTVAVYKDDTDMLNVDYYEVKWHNGVEWVEMPTGALVNFQRKWMKLETVGPYPTGLVEFNWSSRIDTGGSNHQVAESRLHYEANGPFSDWTASMNRRIWLENKHLVFPLDSRKLGDGLHRFHVVGWQVDAAGRLTNPRVLPVCSTQQENELILRIDNQVIDELGHPSDHNCGPVHTCTREPDTHILSVKVDGVPLDPCETIGTRSGVLQIDFMASDSGSHLGGYTLNAHWGLSDSHSLLDRPHSNVTVSSTGVQTGWQTGMNRGVYGIALSQPGASAPAWSGGVFRLTVPLDEAFPDPCCYQIRLYAWKRTIVGTSSPNGLKFGCASTHHNTTEYTIGVGV